jgi:sugar porter (SP) family MFS transporter
MARLGTSQAVHDCFDYHVVRRDPQWVRYERSESIRIALTVTSLDTGIISPISSMASFRRDIASTSSTIHGLVVSSVLIPAAVTSLFAGRLADKVGRPYAVTIGSLIFGVGAAMETGAVHLAMFLVGRIVSGLGEGLFLSVTVVYICELAPPSQRGALCGLVQFITAIGVLLGYFIAYGTVKYQSSASWRAPLSVQTGLSFIFAAACAFLPNSPRWLVLRGRRKESMLLWERLGVPATLREEEEIVNNDGLVEKPEDDETAPREVDTSSHSLLRVFQKDVRGRTALGCFTMAMLQLSGIDSILYYSPQVFIQTGLVDEASSFLASGVIAVVIVAITVPGVMMADRWNRKTGTILGGVFISIFMIIIGSLYASGSVHPHSGPGRWVVIVAIYLYVISYCITWAVLFRGYPSEIQPPVTRAAASSLAQAVNWVWSAIYTQSILR